MFNKQEFQERMKIKRQKEMLDRQTEDRLMQRQSERSIVSHNDNSILSRLHHEEERAKQRDISLKN